MTTYLIDMENAHFRWGCLLNQFNPEDNLALFYSINIAAIPLQFLEGLLATKIKMETIQCHTGPNALDFQLVSELGARINANQQGTYVIVSSDHGYDPVIRYWQDRHISISRYTPPAKTQPITTSTVVKPALFAKPAAIEQNTQPETTPAGTTGQTRFIAAANRHVMSEHTSTNKTVHQTYIDKLHAAGIPAEHMNKVADAILMAMDKPQKRRRISIYNGILAAFGKQSGTLYYKKSEYVISDILVNGPFPEL